jgi:nicotinate-nucleotide pyrophosphorylase (carboxylating)
MGHDLHPPITAVRAAVARALEEDLTPLGDLTSALLPGELTATAHVVGRHAGVLAGRACVTEVFAQVDPTIVVDWRTDDGDPVAAGQVLGTVSGPLHAVLTGERTALNFVGHLSGIATLTRQYVEAAGGAVRVWDTRKTTPGLRSLEKAAVRAGGGSNHRGNLSDWILLKDNHIALFGLTDAVKRAHERWPARTVHVECDHIDQVREAVAAGADALLLDNMAPDIVRACVAAVAEHLPAGGRRPLLEVSGGITLETIGSYADTGVDLISVGAITNSAPVLDIGLDIGVH